MQLSSPPIDLCQGADEDQLLPLWPSESSPEPDPRTRLGGLDDTWDEHAAGLAQALAGTLRRKWQETARLEALEREVVLLKHRVAGLEQRAPVCVPVETLAPEPYQLLKPFHVVIQTEGDEYVASFFDANLNASGATEEEALVNLKDTIVAVFELLTEHNPSQLGPGPLRQLQVLREFVMRSV